ncbi:MAG TPA: hypothetical protein VJY41_05835 [Prolixibacteraceae bacterium]|nr:hypothetical protein [Prolixibacteraceae bacterium]
MKKILFLSIFLIFSIVSFAQSQQDYKDYLIENIEGNPALDNYKLYVFFNINILKEDAEYMAGRNLSSDQFSNLFIYGYEIYRTNKKSQLMGQAFKCIDMSGIKKVSTYQDNFQGKKFYVVKIYMNNGYLSTSGSPDVRIENKYEHEIKLNCKQVTAENIKKSILKLAKMNGASDAYDGNDLFN